MDILKNLINNIETGISTEDILTRLRNLDKHYKVIPNHEVVNEGLHQEMIDNFAKILSSSNVLDTFNIRVHCVMTSILQEIITNNLLLSFESLVITKEDIDCNKKTAEITLKIVDGFGD